MRLLLGTLAAVLMLPAAASAKIIELGDPASASVPSCPASPCEVISRTTAFQSRVGGKRRLFVAPAAGRIVAWSITLGTPKPKQREYFEETLGGPAQAGVTVLKQGDRRYGRVTAASPMQTLTAFFGETVQFPLGTVAADRRGRRPGADGADLGSGARPRPRAAATSGARAGTSMPATTPRPRARRPTCAT